MKKTLAVLIVSLGVGTASHAATIRDNCGCGIGTMALGDKEATLVMQLSATFLNGLFGNQTFGISSGTLDCDPWDAFAYNKQLIEFVADNMDHVAMDMAMGSGDSLDAMADLMLIDNVDRPALFAALQSNFDRIFTSEDVTAGEVVRNISEVTQS